MAVALNLSSVAVRVCVCSLLGSDVSEQRIKFQVTVTPDFSHSYRCVQIRTM